jgi:hypothetical protein
MERRQRESHCPDCGQVPKVNESEVLSCGCEGKTWVVSWGVPCTETEQTRLLRSGFRRQDIQGDTYYVGPLGHIIYFYGDSTWSSDKAKDGWTLDQYLDWLDEAGRII